MGKEIELDGQRYSIGRLSAMQQLHVSRRIGPIVPKLIPLYLRLTTGASLKENLADTAELVQPFMDELAEMPDERLNYVIDACMGVVQRKNTAGWSRIWTGPGGPPMFDDIDLGVLLPLTTQVITENLGPFIRGLLTAHGGGPTKDSEKSS